MNDNALEQLIQAASDQELAQLQATVQHGGYSAFHQLLESYKQLLKDMKDEQVQQVFEWVHKGARPGRVQSVLAAYMGGARTYSRHQVANHENDSRSGKKRRMANYYR
ncbi:hypothetical protein [Paenibacillus piri]|uniref:Uncharacterized protein n=1 Tax=Paenibacillus piri TaxID=2547395 RepID=A0A4R5KUV6_9BACL|nr:hypothetical protein [Paenibacillus piri]TDF99723.1 hypothetical protein E1757_07820 [Paenibacillus piri]